jgi:hypothetical protein
MPDSRQYINDSLLITPQLCEEHKGCGQGMAYMKRFYPNGFTVDDVYTKKARHIPMHFVCWGYHFLPFTEEDKRKFIEYAKIVDSKQWYDAHHITNCSMISHSAYCENSTDINSSENVQNSNHIFGCKGIVSSEYVNSSDDIDNTQYCTFSSEVRDSKYVFNSTNVADSYCINGSNNIKNCYLLHEVNDIENAIASTQSNRIFCDDKCVPEFEYAILNKKVSKSIFDLTFQRLVEHIVDEPIPNADSDAFSYLPARANLVKTILPIISEILSVDTEEDKKLLFMMTLCSDILR